MNFDIILDKAIGLATEVENIILALCALIVWLKNLRERSQLTKIMHFSETKNDDFKKLAEQKGLKTAAKILRKLLP